MKNRLYAIAMIGVLALGLISCSESDDDITAPPSETLTQEEKSDLVTLREEEKLARDVYLYSFDKHGLQISSNIAQSEQTHMDRVLTILEAYGIPDPASPERGVFNDSTLQNLYSVLTAKADSSVLDALLVGATVEDLDIRDIEEFKTRTNKADILAMYDNLTCGSRNHLRGYYSQLVDNGGTYEPQFISKEEFDTIINSNRERCGSN